MPKTDDAYRWTPTNVVAAPVQSSVTPEKIKKALQHERTPEMRDKLEQESIAQDAWSQIASALEVPRLVKQMALNAAMEREGDHFTLLLRAEQAHLNTEKATEALVNALSAQLGKPVTLTVVQSDQGITPLEWRDKLYTEKLEQAAQSLNDDPNVRFICQRFAAQIDEDSIRPL